MWKLESAWGPEAHLDQLHSYVPSWEPAVGGTSPLPAPEPCFALLCVLLCKEHDLVSACSFFFLAALLCMQLETLPAC